MERETTAVVRGMDGRINICRPTPPPLPINRSHDDMTGCVDVQTEHETNMVCE